MKDKAEQQREGVLAAIPRDLKFVIGAVVGFVVAPIIAAVIGLGLGL